MSKKKLYLVMKLLTSVEVEHRGKKEMVTVGGVRGFVPVYETEIEALKAANNKFEIVKIQLG